MSVPPLLHPPAIRAEGLSKAFGGFLALQEVSLSIPGGVIFGLFGRNGSGKSTLTRILSGLLTPTGGKVWVNGHDLESSPLEVKRSIGVLSEDMGLIELLSVWEHMLLACSAHGLPGAEGEARSRKLLEHFELWSDRGKFPGQLSFGMSKKVSLAMALVHNPKVLFLDEPFEGLDPIMVKGLRELLGRLAEKGLAIFITSHSLDLVEKLVHRFAILHEGRIVHASSISEMAVSGGTLEETFLRFVQPQPASELEWIG